mmetsp:Transcript_43175/g.63494  ORF Transcript_43175/g.63494 Transcript_43175/m.63494 type:complete len:221 (-) Transcript_43175:57-719(-)
MMDRPGIAHGSSGASHCAVASPMQGADLHRWTRARVTQLLPRDQESFLDPDVVVSALLAADNIHDLRTDARNLMSAKPGVHQFVEELWQHRQMQGVHSGGTYIENNAAARAPIAGPTGSFSRTQGREYGMHPRAANAMPAMRYPSTQTVEAYVHVRFQELGLNMPEIENYVADVLKMKDDELSPLDDALEQIEDLLRGLGVQDQMVREFVRNAPVAASIF